MQAAAVVSLIAIVTFFVTFALALWSIAFPFLGVALVSFAIVKILKRRSLDGGDATTPR